MGGSEQAESQKQMGGCETLIIDLNGCSLQKASHQQSSTCPTWWLVSEELPGISLQPNKSLGTQVQIGTTCVPWVDQTPTSLQMHNFGVRSGGCLDANSEVGLGSDLRHKTHARDKNMQGLSFILFHANLLSFSLPPVAGPVLPSLCLLSILLSLKCL